MNPLNLNDIVAYVESNIGTFHIKRLEKIQNLELKKDLLKRKNPYLFKAKNVLSAESLVRGILDAFLSSQEETIFGDFLEGLAIFVCSKVFGGQKSTQEGIDLEFDRDGIKYVVEIKSGPNWGNSSQLKKMKENFAKAQQFFRATNPNLKIVPINGCCYGRDDVPDKGDYFKYCGQRFWSFISDNDDLYVQIVEPLGHQAKQKNEDFEEAYYQIINKFTFEFGEEFCVDGKIDWSTLVQFSSAERKVA